MSSSLHRPRQPQTTPFHIYNTEGLATQWQERNYRRLQSVAAPTVPTQNPPGRARSGSANVLTSPRFSPIQKPKNQLPINIYAIWTVVGVLLTVLFGLMIAPELPNWTINPLSEFGTQPLETLPAPIAPAVPAPATQAHPRVTTPRMKPSSTIRTRTVRVVTTTATGTTRSRNGLFMAPPLTQGVLTSSYGYRWRHRHQGVDLAAHRGTPVYAVSGGRVVLSGWSGGYGKSILIDHGKGYKTRYAHCSRLLTNQGQRVSAGQLIARVGSTGHSSGPHLHFEVLMNNRPMNPARFFRLTAPFVPWAAPKSAAGAHR
jgi:murein DD-endopeptidase MepM/ murein hydrolase activator NlpD